MANDQTLNKIAGFLRGSQLMREPEPMRFRMPACTPATASMYLHQVWLVPAVSRRSQDLIVQIELNKFERDESGEDITDVDDLLAGYINGGQFVFRDKWGRVTFVRKDGAVMWPERYVLQPTFRPEDLQSKEAGRKRLEDLHEARKGWCPKIELRWSLIEEAVKSGKRVDDKNTSGKTANLYEAFAGDGGPELWAARLPKLWKTDRPDKEHFIVVSPDRNGVAVRLTAGFLANLCAVIPAVLEDGLDFASQYYLRRIEESGQGEPDTDEDASDEEDSDD